MFAAAAHFALGAIGDPAARCAHLEWQFLSRHPAAMLDPEVAGGAFWARAPDCAAATVAADPEFDGIDYAEAFWLRRRAARVPPASARAGRRPLDARFVPVKGYVVPRVLVSSDALVLRPARAVHLVLTRFVKHDAEAEDVFRWYDQVRIPDLLECRGVAGAWSFAAASLFEPSRDVSAPALRILLVHLDGEPLDFLADLADREPARRRAGRLRDTGAVEQPVFAGAFDAVVPFRWDRGAG